MQLGRSTTHGGFAKLEPHALAHHSLAPRFACTHLGSPADALEPPRTLHTAARRTSRGVATSAPPVHMRNRRQEASDPINRAAVVRAPESATLSRSRGTTRINLMHSAPRVSINTAETLAQCITACRLPSLVVARAGSRRPPAAREELRCADGIIGRSSSEACTTRPTTNDIRTPVRNRGCAPDAEPRWCRQQRWHVSFPA